jgi:hypothetical protein
VDGLQHALEGVTKLHGVAWGEAEGVSVDTIESVVHYDPWAAIALGDHPQGTEAEVGEMLYEVIWEEDPLTPLHHIYEFGLEEFQIFDGGLV